MNKIKPLDQNMPIVEHTPNRDTKILNKIETRASILERLIDFAKSVPDFRRTNKGNIRHRLSDIIMLMILARLSKQIARGDIIEFGKHNLNKLQKMGILKNGVPSEPTLCRVENGIDSLAMADRMREFAEAFQAELLDAVRITEIICIDGKAERGTILENGRNPDIVSAYSFNTGITLATEACEEKSNEIKAVPRLLDKIKVTGKILTADAMSMQKDIIDIIRERGGDFMIELKANQRALRYSVEDGLGTCCPVYSYTEGPELAHGRIETRTYSVYDGLDLIADKDKWGGKMTIIECKTESTKKSTGETTSERRLYVCSLPTDSPRLGRLVRDHWSIESMHWSLDVTFRQDQIKRKIGKSARNLDTIQRTVCSTFSIWRGLRKKRDDKNKGITELLRHNAAGFTNLLNFLRQK